jgi:predicted GNAT family N-acyltransferase
MIPTADYFIVPADWNVDNDALRHVRTEVFVIEQRIPEAEEWDALDTGSYHVLARDTEDRPIGTGRLTPDHMIGRIAVLKEWRGRHVGDAIMRTLIERARAVGWPEVELHAQSYAIPFYAKFGFEPFGDEFVECDIPHRRMRLALPAPEAPYRPVGRLDETPTPRLIAVDDRDQAIATVNELLGLARRELCIYTRDLDPALFDNDAALEHLRRIGIAGPRTSIRVVIQHPQAPLRDGHRLVNLARRLPSVFQFRVPLNDEDLQYPSAFLLTDRRSYYFRVLGSRFEGEAHTYAPGRHAQLLDYFNQVWERSAPSEELRQLSL